MLIGKGYLRRRTLPNHANVRSVWQERYVRCGSSLERRCSAKPARAPGAPRADLRPVWKFRNRALHKKREADIVRLGARPSGAPAPRHKMPMAGAVRALRQLVEAEMLRKACPGTGRPCAQPQDAHGRSGTRIAAARWSGDTPQSQRRLAVSRV